MHWSLLPDLHLFGLSTGESRVVMMTWIAMGIVGGTLWLAFRRMAAAPRGMQNAIEFVHDGLSGLAEGVMGRAGFAYLPFIVTIFLFIFVANYLGLVPGLEAPTSNLNTPLALALTVFVSFLVLSIVKQGIGGFLKHLAGPMQPDLDVSSVGAIVSNFLKLLLSIVMFLIEIVSLLARPFSLTLRLFINMTAGHQLTAVLLALAGPVATLWMGFETLITCWIQAIVFALLTMIYFGEALAGAGEHH